MQPEEDKFKALLKSLVYPVCVISGISQTGTPKAITVSSVTSVSFSPQSLLVCINKDSSFYEILSKGCKLSLSFLNSNQSNIAKICSIDNERFNNDFWNFDDDDIPSVKDSLGNILCSVSNIVDHGTHAISILDVIKINFQEKNYKSLLYGNQSYIIS